MQQLGNCEKQKRGWATLRITKEFFEAQNPDFLRISEAQKILSDSYKKSVYRSRNSFHQQLINNGLL